MTQYVITLQENQAGLSFIEFVRNLNFIINIEPVQQKRQAKTISDKMIPLPKKMVIFLSCLVFGKTVI
ncbi:MAG: hypothetical protein HY738_15860 [Bacteroidia bacterium]|nr:hypothetical protein [Bacteroidia bacterium]